MASSNPLSDSSTPLPDPSPATLILLVALTASAPVSLQIFLPTLPAIKNHFAVSAGVVQYTLTLAILANAFATLAYGPLSDRFGRRPVLLGGLTLFVAGSIAAIFANQIHLLIAARILQSAGAAAGLVLARTIIRDLYDTERAARAIAYLTMAMVVAPMISPTIGALLIDAFGWRAVFVALAGFAVVLCLWAYTSLAETRPSASASGNGVGLVTGAIMLLKRPQFLAFTFQSTFAISTFFSFLAGAAYFMVDVLGRTATEYGLYFMMVSGCYMVGNFLSARTVRHFGLERLIITGSSLSFGAVILSLILLVNGYWEPLSLFAPVSLAAIGNGLSIPNSMAGAMSIDRNLAGTASGVLGFSQMFFSALVAQAVGELENGTPYPMAWFMVVCAALSLGGYLAARFLPKSQRCR
ncbi:MAG: Bcr/CflA family drug resistance efflux transporter [marine bacterium B5-7]|nr:MAG: Bcr/CflA family drug resistance efflux transporter [marine bacterium B5-7]